MNPAARLSPRLRECPICGQFQVMPALGRRAAACCVRCHCLLRQNRTDPAGRALALAFASVLLFVLAASLPFLNLDLGAGGQTRLISGPEALQQDGMAALGIVVLVTTMIAPVAKLVLLIWVLLGLRLEHPPAYLTTLFRWVERLSPWSMIEVFMLGVFVSYTKLSDLAPLHVGGAVYALGALMLMMAATDAVLDHEAIWEQLEPPGMAAHTPRAGMKLIGCDACGQVSERQPFAAACPRCGARLRHRKPNSLSRGWALTASAAVLYIPANTLPVLTAIRLGQGQPSTILGGALELGAAGQWPLAALIFVASVAIPVLKLAGMATLLFTTQRGLRTNLHQRTLLYRVVDAVGRWSMIDVFVISILAALVRMGALASVTPGPGILCFCAVVILTMLAAESFDPRLMWDGEEPVHAALPAPDAMTHAPEPA